MSPTSAVADEGDESSRERRLRYRTLFVEYRTVLLVAFVVLLALGGWLSYGAYAVTGEETDQRLEDEWTATGSFSHGSVVTEPNAIYPEGTQLENEPLYYESVTPTVDGEFVGGYDAASGENVTVELTVDLVYRAAEPEGDTVYWSERERLESVAETDVAPNEAVTASVSVNVTEVQAAIDEIEADLEASPGATEIFLDVERTVAGTIDGDERSTSDRYALAIDAGGGTYQLETDGTYDETHEEYATETVPVSAGPLRTIGGPLVLLVGLAGICAVGVATHRLSPPTVAEREWLAYRDDRAEFDELITTANLPASALEGPRADVDALATLARLGVDLESAVIFDPERHRYLVRDEELRYVFEPPRLATEDDVLAPAGGEERSSATTEPTGTTTDPTGATTAATSSDSLERPDTATEALETPSGSVSFSETEGLVSRPDLERAAQMGTATDPPAEPSVDPVVESGSGRESGTEQESDTGRESDSVPDPADESASDTATQSEAEPAEPPAESTPDSKDEPVSDRQDSLLADSPAELPLELLDHPVSVVDLESSGDDSSADINDDDLLGLAGLEPADISEPELFDLSDADESIASESATEDGDKGAEHRSGSGSDA